MRPKHEDFRAAEILQECLNRLAERPGSDLTDRFERAPRLQREGIQRALEGALSLRQGLPDALVPASLVDRLTESLRRRRELRERLPELRAALAALSPAPGFAAATGAEVIAALRERIGPAPAPTAATPGPTRRGSSTALSTLPLEAAERAVERYWGAAAPVDPASVAEQMGILVLESPCADCEALLALGAEVSVIAVNSSLEDPNRRRSAIAHELGHFVLHRNQASDLMDPSIDAAGREERDREANAFAAALLIPELLLRRRGPVSWPTLDKAETVARDFATSLTHAALRIVQRSDVPSMLIAFWEGRSEWAVRSEYFPVTWRAGKPAPDSSATAAVIAGDPPPPDYAEIHASEWFPGIQKVEDNHLQEHVREIYPGLVLTVLNVVG